MKTVAVIGASRDRDKFGNRAVRGFRRQGYTVVPITTQAEAIEGLRAYPSVRVVPHTIDMATVYLPPVEAVRVIDEIADAGIPEVWLNPGADGPEVVARARARGLEPTIACSLLAIGESPAGV